MSTTLRPTDVAAMTVDRITEYADALCDAMRAEQTAILERDELHLALTNSFIGQPNPLTNKPHSQTSAEALAKEDESYKAAQVRRQEAEYARIRASARYEQAKLTARLTVGVVVGDEAE